MREREEYWKLHSKEKVIGGGRSDYSEIYYRVLNLLPKDENVKILDVGCGTGNFEVILNSNGFKNVTAIDISRKFLNIAKRRAPPYTYLKFDAGKKIPFRAKNFDIVTSIEVLEHMLNPLAFIKELLRVGKRTIITTPNGFWVEFYQWVKGIEKYNGEYFLFTENEIKNLIKMAGGNIKRFDYFYGGFSIGRNILPKFLSSKFIIDAEK